MVHHLMNQINLTHMKNIFKPIQLIFLLLLSGVEIKAQQPFALEQAKFYVFDRDSLQGFEEEAASRAAISEGFTGAEYPGRMAATKRGYINAKYNLIKHIELPDPNLPLGKIVVSPACTNEDFEASTAGTVTTQNQITGWTITRGQVQ